MQAELMEYTDKAIKVKRYSDFQIVKIPLEMLSAEDRDFVLGMAHKREKDNSMKEGPYASQVTGQFVKGTSKQGLLYQFFGNPKWDPTKRYPLVINLHGSGSSGNDNEKQMGGATKVFTSSENQAERPCFMLAPQCPDQNIGWKKEVADHLMELIADLVEKLPIDPDRIYLTGSSMGGFGTWSLAAKYPNVFACAVPLCGSGDPKTAEQLKTIPIWAFHGDQDPMVPVERDRAMNTALKAIGANNQYSELLFTKATTIGGVVYAKHELHEWIFAQNKSARPGGSGTSG